MAEVSCRLRAGLQKLTSVKAYHGFSSTDSSPASSTALCCRERAVLESRRERDSQEERAERVKVKDLAGTQQTGYGLRRDRLSLVPQPSLTPNLVLLDGEQAIIVGLIGQLPSVGSSGTFSRYRMTAGSSRMHNTGHLSRSFCTLILLSHRQPRNRSTVSLTQACSWSSNQSSNSPPQGSPTAYYEILQVSPSATQAQIKTAYYKQSFLYHPDKNAGSEEATHRFAQISEAYSILGSVGLRKKYDRGILSSTDIQGAGRPSSKETSASSYSTSKKKEGKRHTHTLSKMTVEGKTVFDFDAFYQAHYGQQLRREKAYRQLKKESEEDKKKVRSDIARQVVVAMMIFGVVYLYSKKS